MNDDRIGTGPPLSALVGGAAGRRRFLKGAAASMVVLFREGALRASAPEDPPGPPVGIGVVGAGAWGREILASLSRVASARVAAVAETYAPYLARAREIAPAAAPEADYRRLLESRDVEAVVVATPTHLHRAIAVEALQAGKHVYCEAPLAAGVDDARAIASAAQQASKLVFQAGLQGRSNALYKHVAQFVKSGVLGAGVHVAAQWNKKTSWRRAAPTPERERELNWRLAECSAGLVGEVGVHHLDLIGWYLRGLPNAVTGFGSTTHWRDGREVPDTVHCVFEYPNGVRAVFTSTLASSFSDSFTLFAGSNSSLMMRETRGWMVKEADSPLLGWEVYARKEAVHNETGICMIADATKILEDGKEPGKDGPLEPTQTALYTALESFTRSIRTASKPACGPVEGFQAAVAAVKANEAVLSSSRIVYPPEAFKLS